MRAPRANSYRDAWCGELDAGRAGSEARVAGWVHGRRDHGGLIFIDLRDRSGIVQLVFHPDRAPEEHAAAHRLRAEHVLSAAGEVVRRAPENVNPAIPTGEVELAVSELDVLAEAATPPFPLDEEGAVDEALRLRHRALDLRREPMRDGLLLRHRVVTAMREALNERDFVELETPILTRSTPEGARDFLVPARVEPGSWFALPQSPQLFKQLLMMAGFERYYQIARCFRDEDQRADRQPEFTQLDVEMSFVHEDDVIATTEAVMSHVFAGTGFAVPEPPWPRLSYAEAIARYGIDRPDTRFGLEIVDVGDAVRDSGFQVFTRALGGGGVVRALNAGARELARAELDALTDLARRGGAAGLVWAFVQEDGTWRSPIAKFLSEGEVAVLTERLGGRPGDLLLAVADRAEVAARVLGALRQELAARFDLVPERVHQPLWVVDFPMFEWSEAERRWDPVHHPFTAPAAGDGGAPSWEDPAALRARAYDLVLDGFEIGGGSIRINRIEDQERVFSLIGLGAEEARRRFGFLLDAMRYGAPPHGGIALGLDRIAAMLAGRRTAREVMIREVIAFPKTASGQDPLTGAPAPVDDAQLRPLGVRVDVPRGGSG